MAFVYLIYTITTDHPRVMCHLETGIYFYAFIYFVCVWIYVATEQTQKSIAHSIWTFNIENLDYKWFYYLTMLGFTPKFTNLKQNINAINLSLKKNFFFFLNVLKRIKKPLLWKPLFKKNSYFGLYRNVKNNKFINTTIKK